jgi:hypothetical protein
MANDHVWTQLEAISLEVHGSIPAIASGDLNFPFIAGRKEISMKQMLIGTSRDVIEAHVEKQEAAAAEEEQGSRWIG